MKHPQRSRFLRTLALAAGLTGTVTFAAEGMWTLDNLPLQALQRDHGFVPDGAWLDRVMKSSARVSGCSGAFVSADGLVMTNHHCITGCLSQLSTVTRNLTEQGFLAATREQELRCPQTEVNRLESSTDVTERMRQATAGLTGAAFQAAQDRTRAEMIRECQGTAAGVSTTRRCEVVSLYRGGEYRLHRYHRYADVRLVWAPEEAIGAFGGDPDNFNFPRWCLDAAFLRVYENGKPAAVAHHFPFQTRGPQADEVLFIPGHPGSTQRLLTVAQLEAVRDRLAQRDIPATSEVRGLLYQYAQGDAEAKRLAQAALSGVENGLKVQQGQLAALLEPALLERKRREEAALKAFVASRPELRERVGDPWSDIERAVQVRREIGLLVELLVDGRAFPGTLFNSARTLVRGAVERNKPEGQRLREFSDAALPRLERALAAPVPVNATYEQARLSWGLTRMRSLLGQDHPLVGLVLGDQSPQQVAASLVQGTLLADPAERMRLWRASAQEVIDSRDPYLQFVRKLEPMTLALRQRLETEVSAVEAQAGQRIAQAQFAMTGRSTYPDATGTLRLSYGTLKGWNEGRQAVSTQTDFAGVYGRATGAAPFALPASWIAAKPRLEASRLMSQPFNYVTDHDIIGGNSGSPMINRAGEVVGLVFDGNRHSLGGSFSFDPRINRAVSVHAGAIVQALRQVYGAQALLQELGQQQEGR